MGKTVYKDIVQNVKLTFDTFCPHRMEDHVLMYLDEGMVELTENNHTTRLTSGDCAFIRKDCNVMMNKKCIDGKPFMATFLTFKRSFLQETFRSFDKATLPSNARRSNNSVIKLPNNRPDIKSLFDSLKPYYESKHHALGRTAQTENDRRAVCAAEHRQEPLCLAVRLQGTLEDRHPRVHEPQLSLRPIDKGNSKLYRAQPFDFQTRLQETEHPHPRTVDYATPARRGTQAA